VGTAVIVSHDELADASECSLSTMRRIPLPDVEAHITGTVWKVECQVGQQVEEGDTLVILESMKMEMPVEAEDEGKVKEIKCEEGQSVSEGDTLVVLE
jgi:acetyl-CoA carboxylase biotin carboxyl carrier protein